MQIESVPIDQLRFDPSNARLHGMKNLDAIKGSLSKFGQVTPIVVDEKNIVLKGNGTLQAAKEMGWKSINVVRAALSEIQKAAYAIADNRAGELARWDNDILTKTLLALQEESFDLGEIGFDDTDLDVILGEIAAIPTGGPAPAQEPNAMMTGGKPMDPLGKLNRFLESNVRYMQLIYGEQEYEEVVSWMAALCAHWGMKNHSDLVARLVRENALANNLEPAEYVESEPEHESDQGYEPQTA